MHCPITKINIPRFLISTIIGFAFVFGLDFLIHQNLLSDIYQQTMHLWRPMDEMASFMPYMFGYQALLVIIIGFIYTRNHEGKGITEGLRFGLQIGVLLALLNAAAYIWMPIPKELALAWAGAGLGTGLGLGVIFSLLYKKIEKAKLMAYWLLKSEPYKFSWDDQVKKGEGRWEKRVRNYQARNNLAAMKPGDKGFFYHSNEGKEIVGILEVTSEAYTDPDPTKNETGKFVTVDVKPLTALKNPVTLADLKSHPVLSNMKVVKQVRLSVSPVTEEEWTEVCALGGI